MPTKGKSTQPPQPPHDEGVTVVLTSEALHGVALLADGASPASDGLTIVLEDTQLADATAGDRPTRELPAVAVPEQDAGLTTPVLPSVTAPAATSPRLASAPLDDVARTDDPAATNQFPVVDAVGIGAGLSEIPDETDLEWSVADQPTIQMAPQVLAHVLPPAAAHAPASTSRPVRPAFLETGEQDVWPPRPTPQGQPTPSGGALPAHTPIPRPVTRPLTGPPRIPSPTGKRSVAGSAAAFSNPRMSRLVELRLQRDAHVDGHHAPTDNLPVAQLVRQWWNDLLPGLQSALDHQHEARASGVYPIPAHLPTPVAGLGDAFGRLSAVVRDFGGRAQAVAGPALNRLHERAEHAAQALVEKIEGSPVRQQAPLLGPGRLAVFFEQGVTVGQAQRLLMTNQARPMRLIPRRHGFLALVQPGRESDVGEQLKHHPYVRDVVYLAYDANGQPEPPR